MHGITVKIKEQRVACYVAQITAHRLYQYLRMAPGVLKYVAVYDMIWYDI